MDKREVEHIVKIRKTEKKRWLEVLLLAFFFSLMSVLHDRSIVAVSALVASGITDRSLKYHIENARKNGVTKVEVDGLWQQLVFGLCSCERTDNSVRLHTADFLFSALFLCYNKRKHLVGGGVRWLFISREIYTERYGGRVHELRPNIVHLEAADWHADLVVTHTAPFGIYKEIDRIR